MRRSERAEHTGHWSRDDPAVTAVTLVVWLALSVSYSIAVSRTSVGDLAWALAVGAAWHLGLGALIATVHWWAANRYLRLPPAPHRVEEMVEWGFAFDVHCHGSATVAVGAVLLLLALPFALSSSLLSVVFANSVASCSVVAYVYVTFRGFLALPFLGRNTTVLLYPAVLAVTLGLAMTVLDVNIPAHMVSALFGV